MNKRFASLITVCVFIFILFFFLFFFVLCVWGGVRVGWVCGCVGVCVCVCVCLAYTSEDFHMKTHRYTEDSTPSEDPKTGPRKTLVFIG